MLKFADKLYLITIAAVDEKSFCLMMTLMDLHVHEENSSVYQGRKKRGVALLKSLGREEGGGETPRWQLGGK